MRNRDRRITEPRIWRAWRRLKMPYLHDARLVEDHGAWWVVGYSGTQPRTYRVVTGPAYGLGFELQENQGVRP